MHHLLRRYTLQQRFLHVAVIIARCPYSTTRYSPPIICDSQLTLLHSMLVNPSGDHTINDKNPGVQASDIQLQYLLHFCLLGM